MHIDGHQRRSIRGFWRLSRFVALPKDKQDAILRVAMERAAKDAMSARDRGDWDTYDGSPNWIDR